MNHVGAEPLEHSRQPPGGREVHFGAGGERHQVEPLGGSPQQFAVRVRHQGRAIADFTQAVDGQQHLILAAAPAARRVDVQ